MQQYHDLMKRILSQGIPTRDRTGTGTLALFGTRMAFDLQEGFPLLTSKKLSFHAIRGELLWFISGDTNKKTLQEQNITIWDEWGDENGEMGPIYGAQWRSWPDYHGGVDAQGKAKVSIDQLAQCITTLQNNPTSRRIVVSAWNPADIDDMALPPCHMFFQFDTTGNQLNCQMYQRSADFFLGVPYNIASYALLTHMVAQVCNLKPGVFIWIGGNTHLYQNHIPQAREQLKRSEKPLPTLWLNPEIHNIDDFTANDIKIHNYHPHPAIAAEVSI